MSVRKLPQIRIKNAWLLRDSASVHLHELWAKEGEKLATNDEIDKIAEGYMNAWKPYEEKVLTGMCDALGLTFRQDIIDVYIAPWFHAFSDPMVIGVTYEPDRFVSVLTHELLHRLLTDNTESSYGTKYATHWKELFGNEHSFVAVVHIPVHATMQTIFDDILNEPERTIKDKEKCKKSPAYDKAWEYVEANGYKDIVGQLKEQYSQMREQGEGHRESRD